MRITIDGCNVREKSEKSSRANYCFAGLLVLIAVFYIGTVRAGHLWADDFAMYVHHAQNIVEGQPYAATGYIYNARVQAYSPGMYPPVFPLLLAPLYKFFGLNLLPMKREQVVFFLLTLVAVFVCWGRDLGAGYALALIAIFGFSPVFWAAKDSVLSDLPFMMFFYGAAVIAQRAPSFGSKWWLWAILLGVTVYAAIGTRVAGIALIAGLVLYDLLQHRKITRFTGVAVAACFALFLLQGRLTGPAPGGYMEQVRAITAHTIVFNLAGYTRVLAGFWVASVRNGFSLVVLAIVAPLIIAGIYFRHKSGFTMIEALLAPYIGLLLLWPYFAGVRAVFPVIPWMVFLALTGLGKISESVAPRYAAAAAWGLLLILAVPFAEGYRSLDFGPIRENQGLPEFKQLCEAVRHQTAASDVFIYYRARALSLYTGRQASTYNHRGTEAELKDYLPKIHAAYLVTTDAFDDDHGFLKRYVQDHADDVDLTYQNAMFRMYRIRGAAETANAPDPPRNPKQPASAIVK